MNTKSLKYFVFFTLAILIYTTQATAYSRDAVVSCRTEHPKTGSVYPMGYFKCLATNVIPLDITYAQNSQENISNFTKFSATERQKLLDRRSAILDDLPTTKLAIQAATTRNVTRNLWNTSRAAVRPSQYYIQIEFSKVSHSMLVALNKIDTTAEGINASKTELAAAGKDVNVLSGHLDAINTERTRIRTALLSAITQLTNLVPDAGDRTIYQANKTAIQSIRTTLTTLRTDITTLRTGPITLARAEVTRLGGGGPPPPGGPTVTLSAVPLTVAPGGAVTLSWTSSGASFNYCVLETDGVVSRGALSTSGSFILNPNTNTTYRMKCVGPGSRRVFSNLVNVTVGPTPPPPGDFSISVSPKNPSTPGQMVTISYNTGGADKVCQLYHLRALSLAVSEWMQDNLGQVQGAGTKEISVNDHSLAILKCGQVYKFATIAAQWGPSTRGLIYFNVSSGPFHFVDYGGEDYAHRVTILRHGRSVTGSNGIWDSGTEVSSYTIGAGKAIDTSKFPTVVAGAQTGTSVKVCRIWSNPRQVCGNSQVLP